MFGALRLAQRICQRDRPHNPNDFAAVERLEGRLTNVEHFARLGGCRSGSYSTVRSSAEEGLSEAPH